MMIMAIKIAELIFVSRKLFGSGFTFLSIATFNFSIVFYNDSVTMFLIVDLGIRNFDRWIFPLGGFFLVKKNRGKLDYLLFI